MTTKKEKYTARQRADQLLNQLNHDKAVNEIFNETFSTEYKIYGKTPDMWKEYFKVNIPENPNTEQCKIIAARLASLYQEATFYYAASEIQLEALSSGEFREYTGTITRLYKEYETQGKKRPAASLLQDLVNNDIKDIKSSVYSAKIVRIFWKRMIEGLTEVRKHVELATWSNSTQAKQEQYMSGNIPTNLPDRGGVDASTKE